MKSVTKRIYLIDFSLAVLGYILFVLFDTLNKKLIGSYHVSQIIFINTISAFLPIFIFTQKRKAATAVISFSENVYTTEKRPRPS